MSLVFDSDLYDYFLSKTLVDPETIALAQLDHTHTFIKSSSIDYGPLDRSPCIKAILEVRHSLPRALLRPPCIQDPKLISRTYDHLPSSKCTTYP